MVEDVHLPADVERALPADRHRQLEHRAGVRLLGQPAVDRRHRGAIRVANERQLRAPGQGPRHEQRARQEAGTQPRMAAPEGVEPGPRQHGDGQGDEDGEAARRPHAGEAGDEVVEEGVGQRDPETVPGHLEERPQGEHQSRDPEDRQKAQTGELRPRPAHRDDRHSGQHHRHEPGEEAAGQPAQ